MYLANSRFVVCVRDQLNEPCMSVVDAVRVVIIDAEGRQVRFSMSEGQNGVFKVNWRPLIEGDHAIAISVRDRHIKDSPFR